MIEYLMTALSGLIGTVLGGLTVYVIIKRDLNPMQYVDEILTEIQTNKDSQQKIYVLGAILGQGIKGGVGLATKGNKLNLEGILGAAIQQFLPSLLGQKQENQPGPVADNFKTPY